MKKVATSRKSKTHTNRYWKSRPLSICMCLIVMFKMLIYSLYL